MIEEESLADKFYFENSYENIELDVLIRIGGRAILSPNYGTVFKK